MPKRNPAKAIQMLDMLLEFFGEEGQRWITGEWHDDHGNRCLASAMAHLRAVMKLRGDTAGDYLRAAIPPDSVLLPRGVLLVSYGPIEDFNDDCRSYEEIRAVILKARDLAQAEFDRQRKPAAARPARAIDMRPVEHAGSDRRS
jgi:hypothetical protein